VSISYYATIYDRLRLRLRPQDNLIPTSVGISAARCSDRPNTLIDGPHYSTASDRQLMSPGTDR